MQQKFLEAILERLNQKALFEKQLARRYVVLNMKKIVLKHIKAKILKSQFSTVEN